KAASHSAKLPRGPAIRSRRNSTQEQDMNTQRLSMLSLMLVAAAGWTPSGLDAAANAAAPQSLAAIPLVFDTWVPGPCSPNGQPQGQCPPGDLFRVRLVPIAEGLATPRPTGFTPGGGL